MTLRNNVATGAAQSVRVNHPTGATGVVAAAAVVIAKWAGVEVSVEDAAVVFAAVVVVASGLSPRFRTLARDQLADNDPPAGDTGPDELEAQFGPLG